MPKGVHMDPDEYDDFDPLDDFEIDGKKIRKGDACTAAEFCRDRGLHRCIVNSWRTRGYLDTDGNRVYVKPRGKAWINGRVVPVYLIADLAAAELATRDKGGHNRKDPLLAWSQRQMRARRAERRDTAA